MLHAEPVLVRRSIELINYIAANFERTTQYRVFKRHAEITQNRQWPVAVAAVVVMIGKIFFVEMRSLDTEMSLSFATQMNLLEEVIEPSPS